MRRVLRHLSDYTSVPFEFFVVTFSVAPILVLIYFYGQLPERIPVFLNLRGEVEVWAAKSVASVFRLPAMALDLQLLCLVMKYGLVQSRPRLSDKNVQVYLPYQQKSLALSAGLWDWFRCLIAIKMSAASLDIFFIKSERLHFLWTPARVVTWFAAILSIVGAILYGYRLLMVKREMKEADGKIEVGRQVDRNHLYGGVLYHNPHDPAPFVPKYVLNFANKWVYALILCIVAYPLLVFWPL